MKLTRRILSGGVELLMPHACRGCGETTAPEDGPLCAGCAADLARCVAGAYCRRCGEDRHPHLLIDGRCTRCRTTRPRFDEFIRVGRYDGVLSRLILQFKHRFILDAFLGGLLADAVSGRLDAGQIDRWTPVPSHWRRRLHRGFHPTALLVREAARRFGGVEDPCLRVTRYVPRFTHGMSAQARFDAIRGAFRPARGTDLSGRTVCLVDDVTTTGATIREAAGVLRKAGAARIVVAVLAKTAAGGVSAVPGGGVAPVDHPGVPRGPGGSA